MSETPSTDGSTSSNTNEHGEQQSEIPESLRPLMTHMDRRNLDLLNKLNARYDELLQKEMRVVYNGQYNHVLNVERRSKDEAARRARAYVASANGQHHISRNVQNLIKSAASSCVVGFLDDAMVPGVPGYRERYNEVYDSVVSAASIPQEEWLGHQYVDKNGATGYTGGLYDQLREGLPADPSEQVVDVIRREPVEARLIEPEPQTVDSGLDVLDESGDGGRVEDQESIYTPESILRDASEWYKEATVQRQKAPFYKRRKAKREYEAAKQSYGAALADFQTTEIERLRAEGKSNIEILEWVENHANSLADEDFASNKDRLVQATGWIGRQLEKYANASTKKKILIGLGVGALMGVAGVAVGVAAGAVGAGAAVAGTAIGAGRFARTYAVGMSRMYRDAGARPRGEAFGISQSEVQGGDITDDILDRAVNYVTSQGDAIIEKSDKIRRKSVAFAVGSVAVGSGAGILASHASDWIGDGKIGISFGRAEGVHIGTDQMRMPGEVPLPDNPDQSFVEMQEKLVPPDHNAQELFTANAFKGGVDLPIKPGDGFERLAGRYGLSDEQLERLKEVVSSKQGETYSQGGDLRLNLGDGKVHLTSEDVQKIFGADKIDIDVPAPSPEDVPNPGGQSYDQLVPNNPNAQKLFSPSAFENGVRVPVNPGDGFESLGNRYGLNHGQLEALKDVVSGQFGETYIQGGDLRLNLGDRGFNLSADELKRILKAK